MIEINSSLQKFKCNHVFLELKMIYIISQIIEIIQYLNII